MKKLLLIVLAATLLSGCGYNSLQSQDEGIKAAWSEIVLCRMHTASLRRQWFVART